MGGGETGEEGEEGEEGGGERGVLATVSDMMKDEGVCFEVGGRGEEERKGLMWLEAFDCGDRYC